MGAKTSLGKKGRFLILTLGIFFFLWIFSSAPGFASEMKIPDRTRPEIENDLRTQLEKIQTQFNHLDGDAQSKNELRGEAEVLKKVLEDPNWDTPFSMNLAYGTAKQGENNPAHRLVKLGDSPHCIDRIRRRLMKVENKLARGAKPTEKINPYLKCHEALLREILNG